MENLIDYDDLIIYIKKITAYYLTKSDMVSAIKTCLSSYCNNDIHNTIISELIPEYLYFKLIDPFEIITSEEFLLINKIFNYDSKLKDITDLYVISFIKKMKLFKLYPLISIDELKSNAINYNVSDISKKISENNKFDIDRIICIYFKYMKNRIVNISIDEDYIESYVQSFIKRLESNRVLKNSTIVFNVHAVNKLRYIIDQISKDNVNYQVKPREKIPDFYLNLIEKTSTVNYYIDKYYSLHNIKKTDFDGNTIQVICDLLCSEDDYFTTTLLIKDFIEKYYKSSIKDSKDEIKDSKDEIKGIIKYSKDEIKNIIIDEINFGKMIVYTPGFIFYPHSESIAYHFFGKYIDPNHPEFVCYSDLDKFNYLAMSNLALFTQHCMMPIVSAYKNFIADESELSIEKIKKYSDIEILGIKSDYTVMVILKIFISSNNTIFKPYIDSKSFVELHCIFGGGIFYISNVSRTVDFSSNEIKVYITSLVNSSYAETLTTTSNNIPSSLPNNILNEFITQMWKIKK